jgi:outer membrane protein assembly factor BamB
MKSHHPIILVVLLAALPVSANDWPQWRGPQRNGISAETGLLKEWPKDGPKLSWEAKDIGSGYSTPAVVGGRLYLLSNEGLDNEFVAALDAKDGKRLWSATLGKVGNPKQQPNFPAARSTPTVEGDVLYALGSDGDLACVETAAGKVRWHKNIRTDFGGKPGVWAYSESPLIDGDTVVCTPGGDEATIVAFNKKTGDVIWKCAAPGGDEAAYASAIVVESDGVKQYVQLLKRGLMGVDSRTGKFLWRYAKPVSPYGANIPSPVVADNSIYTSAAGIGGGVVKIKANEGAITPEQLYFNLKLPAAIGGSLKVGDYLYGTTAKSLMCVEFGTGQVKWEDPALGTASLCCADGRLYLHGENGQIGLAEVSADSYRNKGQFTPPDQPRRISEMEKAWAYPVVANGKLYVRDQNMLWCYDVKAR